MVSFQVSADHLTVKHYYVKESIPGTAVTSAYMLINNHGDDDVKLLKVTSTLSERIELHQHVFADQMMKMQQVQSISVPAKGSVKLQPHGFHIMIFKPNQLVKQGQYVDLRLYFDDGVTVNLDVPVISSKTKKTH